MNNSTQISALFDIGRVMVEAGLPAIDVQVRASGAVYMDAFSHDEHGPQTWDELLAVTLPWIEALGLERDHYSDEPYMGAGVWRRRLSAWGMFAGVSVTLNASVNVEAPVAAVPS